MSKKVIFGLTGAGKSTLLAQLEHKMKLDLDDLVCKQLGISSNSLGEWIISNGIAQFRLEEMSALKQLFSSQDSFVLALGGGTLDSLSSREFLSTNIDDYIHVKTEAKVCWSRIKDDPNRAIRLMGRDRFLELCCKRLSYFADFKSRLKC